MEKKKKSLYIISKSITRLVSQLGEYLMLLGKQHCCSDEKEKGEKKHNERKILSETQAYKKDAGSKHGDHLHFQ